MILTNLAMICYWLHCFQLRWESPPKFLWYGYWIFVLILNILFSIYYLLVDFTILPFDQTLFSIRGILWSASILCIGLFFIYAYRTYIPVIEYHPVKNAIWLWQIIGVCFALLGGSMVIQRLIGFLGISSLDFLLELPFYEIFFIPASILLLIVTFRYPEALLISQAQVQRACKLYVKLHIHEQSPESKHWGFDRIVDYINSIPESTWEMRCQE